VDLDISNFITDVLTVDVMNFEPTDNDDSFCIPTKELYLLKINPLYTYLSYD